MKIVIFILVGLIATMAAFTAKDMLSSQPQEGKPDSVVQEVKPDSVVQEGKPYIIVYGSPTCPGTKQVLSDLKKEGKNYIYKQLNSKGVSEELIPKIKRAGLDPRRFRSPVVDVNGKFLHSGFNLDDILKWYERPPTRSN